MDTMEKEGFPEPQAGCHCTLALLGTGHCPSLPRAPLTDLSFGELGHVGQHTSMGIRKRRSSGLRRKAEHADENLLRILLKQGAAR